MRQGEQHLAAPLLQRDRDIACAPDKRQLARRFAFGEPSMSRRANCWDNAVAESFFSSLKKERIRKRIYKTRDLARADIFDYIEAFYNRTRRHSFLDGVSPEAFESAAA
jgi:transposase InsO family protein